MRRSARAASAMLSSARAKPASLQALRRRRTPSAVESGSTRPRQRDHGRGVQPERPQHLASSAHLGRGAGRPRRTGRRIPPARRSRGARRARADVVNRRFARRSATPASALPPPSPAPTGICLSTVAANPPGWPLCSTSRSSAVRTSVSPSGRPGASTVVRAARRSSTVSPTSSADDQARELVVAVASLRPDAQEEIDLRRRQRPHAAGSDARAVARATNAPGCSASARARGSMPAAAHMRSTSGRGAQPASASEFASVLRRCANPADTTARIAGQRSEIAGQLRPPAEGDERRVDVRHRHEDRARHGMAPDRIERQRAQDARRPVCRLPRSRQEAVGDLALDEAAPRAHRRQRIDRAEDQRARRRCRGGSRRTRTATARARRGRGASRRPRSGPRSGAPRAPLRAPTPGAGRSRPR